MNYDLGIQNISKVGICLPKWEIKTIEIVGANVRDTNVKKN
jgi:hypothetical protein